jgi:hypothetical protein
MQAHAYLHHGNLAVASSTPCTATLLLLLLLLLLLQLQLQLLLLLLPPPRWHAGTAGIPCIVPMLTFSGLQMLPLLVMHVP